MGDRCAHVTLCAIWPGDGTCRAWCEDCGAKWPDAPPEIRALLRAKTDYILGLGDEGRTAKNWRGARGQT